VTVTGPAAGDLLRTSLVVKAGGSALATKWEERLLEVRVQLGLRSIGRATLTFADPGYELVAGGTLKIGTAVTISAADASAATVLQGKVTAVSSEVSGRAGALAVVTVQDAAYDLTRHVAVETFQDQTLAAIVGALLHDASVAAGTIDVSGTQLPYALRNDSPLGLIDEIAARTGSDWAVHEGKLSMWPASTGSAPGAASVPLRIAFELEDFAVRQVGDGATKVTVRGWDPNQQTAVEGSASTPTARASFDAGGTGETYTVLDAHAATTSQAEAQAVATAIAARTGRVTARGRCAFSPTLRPGGSATVSGAGPGNGTYYVREVTHVYDERGTRTSFVAGDRDPVLLSDPWRAPAPVSSFRRAGLVVGIVDKIDDDPQGQGRVSVQLPQVDASMASAWARVLGAGAGANRGYVLLPEVGDEVLVGFEDDDLTRPVVLGGLFGQKSTRPTVTTKDGKVVTRVLTSRLGHVVELSDGDQDGTQHVRLELATAGHRLRIGKDRTDLEVPSGIPLAITAGSSSIEFDKNGGLTIKAPTITLKADQKVAVESLEVAVKANQKLDLEGTQAQLKATATGSVEAGATLALKGAMVNIN